MAQTQQNEATFEINLLYRHTKSAVEAFGQILNFYEVLNDFDKVIVRNIGQQYIAEYRLDGLEFGSIKTKLTQLLKAVPDDAEKDAELKTAIGHFLIKVKYWLIKLLADEKQIAAKEQVEKVTASINNEITQIGDAHKILVTHVSNYVILNAVDELIKETNELKDKELLEYRSPAGNVYVQKGITINKPKILSELGQRTIINETTELLKIKKVDMLSNEPKWDFLQGKKGLPAKMLDKTWLESFHNRQVIIKPEDALMVTLRTTHTYNPNFDDKKTDSEVVKVLSVITPDTDNTLQMEIPA